MSGFFVIAITSARIPTRTRTPAIPTFPPRKVSPRIMIIVSKFSILSEPQETRADEYGEDNHKPIEEPEFSPTEYGIDNDSSPDYPEE